MLLTSLEKYVDNKKKIFFELIAGIVHMKKLTFLTSVALAAMAAPTLAADLEMEQELGLIVSGKVDSWVGVQFLNRGPLPDKTVFAIGGEGLLSLPLGENLSLQSDFKYEYNDQANDFLGSVAGPRYSYGFAGHLSWRDPSAGLFGVFGGAGTANHGFFGDTDIAFIGGEAQFYMDNITFYGQGGYVDYRGPGKGIGFGLDDGYFVRGVMRWFVTGDSRFQVEGSYFNSDFERFGSTDAFSFGARYDFSLGLPVIGDTALYIAWRGQWRSDCLRGFRGNDNYDLNDQTIMIGSSYSFSGNLLTVDRQGATLDTPDFTHGCGRFETDSDRRLKTDIAELGETDDGIKLYSWKYKSDLVTTWVGVMAQDLETTHPEALVTGADGFYRVNYSRLGVQMMTLEQWNARTL